MPKQPLYPHVPQSKIKQPLYPHVPKSKIQKQPPDKEKWITDWMQEYSREAYGTDYWTFPEYSETARDLRWFAEGEYERLFGKGGPVHRGLKGRPIQVIEGPYAGYEGVIIEQDPKSFGQRFYAWLQTPYEVSLAEIWRHQFRAL